jgi:hypothetical protein
VPGAVRDQIAVNGTGRKLLLRPIFIESDSGERDVLCYVPQNLAAKDNEPFTRMICELRQVFRKKVDTCAGLILKSSLGNVSE